MQFNPGFFNNPVPNYGPNYLSPYSMPISNVSCNSEIMGEGEVTTVVLPDGTTQLYFHPTARWCGSPICTPNCGMNNHGLWFIRSVSNPIPHPCFNQQSVPLYNPQPNFGLFNQQNNNLPCINPFVKQTQSCKSNIAITALDYKFHNDAWTSTTDLPHFCPRMYAPNVVHKPSVAIQASTPCEKSTLCLYEVNNKPYNCPIHCCGPTETQRQVNIEREDQEPSTSGNKCKCKCCLNLKRTESNMESDREPKRKKRKDKKQKKAMYHDDDTRSSSACSLCLTSDKEPNLIRKYIHECRQSKNANKRNENNRHLNETCKQDNKTRIHDESTSSKTSYRDSGTSVCCMSIDDSLSESSSPSKQSLKETKKSKKEKENLKKEGEKRNKNKETDKKKIKKETEKQQSSSKLKKKRSSSSNSKSSTSTKHSKHSKSSIGLSRTCSEEMNIIKSNSNTQEYDSQCCLPVQNLPLQTPRSLKELHINRSDNMDKGQEIEGQKSPQVSIKHSNLSSSLNNKSRPPSGSSSKRELKPSKSRASKEERKTNMQRVSSSECKICYSKDHLTFHKSDISSKDLQLLQRKNNRDKVSRSIENCDSQYCMLKSNKRICLRDIRNSDDKNEDILQNINNDGSIIYVDLTEGKYHLTPKKATGASTSCKYHLENSKPCTTIPNNNDIMKHRTYTCCRYNPQEYSQKQFTTNKRVGTECDRERCLRKQERNVKNETPKRNKSVDCGSHCSRNIIRIHPDICKRQLKRKHSIDKGKRIKCDNSSNTTENYDKCGCISIEKLLMKYYSNSSCSPGQKYIHDTSTRAKLHPNNENKYPYCYEKTTMTNQRKPRSTLHSDDKCKSNCLLCEADKARKIAHNERNYVKESIDDLCKLHCKKRRERWLEQEAMRLEREVRRLQEEEKKLRSISATSKKSDICCSYGDLSTNSEDDFERNNNRKRYVSAENEDTNKIKKKSIQKNEDREERKGNKLLSQSSQESDSGTCCESCESLRSRQRASKDGKKEKTDRQKNKPPKTKEKGHIADKSDSSTPINSECASGESSASLKREERSKGKQGDKTSKSESKRIKREASKTQKDTKKGKKEANESKNASSTSIDSNRTNSCCKSCESLGSAKNYPESDSKAKRTMEKQIEKENKLKEKRFKDEEKRLDKDKKKIDQDIKKRQNREKKQLKKVGSSTKSDESMLSEKSSKNQLKDSKDKQAEKEKKSAQKRLKDEEKRIKEEKKIQKEKKRMEQEIKKQQNKDNKVEKNITSARQTSSGTSYESSTSGDQKHTKNKNKNIEDKDKNKLDRDIKKRQNEEKKQLKKVSSSTKPTKSKSDESMSSEKSSKKQLKAKDSKDKQAEKEKKSAQKRLKDEEKRIKEEEKKIQKEKKRIEQEIKIQQKNVNNPGKNSSSARQTSSGTSYESSTSGDHKRTRNKDKEDKKEVKNLRDEEKKKQKEMNKIEKENKKNQKGKNRTQDSDYNSCYSSNESSSSGDKNRKKSKKDSNIKSEKKKLSEKENKKEEKRLKDEEKKKQKEMEKEIMKQKAGKKRQKKDRTSGNGSFDEEKSDDDMKGTHRQEPKKESETTSACDSCRYCDYITAKDSYDNNSVKEDDSKSENCESLTKERATKNDLEERRRSLHEEREKFLQDELNRLNEEEDRLKKEREELEQQQKGNESDDEEKISRASSCDPILTDNDDYCRVSDENVTEGNKDKCFYCRESQENIACKDKCIEVNLPQTCCRMRKPNKDANINNIDDKQSSNKANVEEPCHGTLYDYPRGSDDNLTQEAICKDKCIEVNLPQTCCRMRKRNGNSYTNLDDNQSGNKDNFEEPCNGTLCDCCKTTAENKESCQCSSFYRVASAVSSLALSALKCGSSYFYPLKSYKDTETETNLEKSSGRTICNDKKCQVNMNHANKTKIVQRAGTDAICYRRLNYKPVTDSYCKTDSALELRSPMAGVKRKHLCGSGQYDDYVISADGQNSATSCRSRANKYRRT